MYFSHQVNLKSIDKIAIAAAWLQNDHFPPHGGDIIQVNTQLRAERISKLTFINVKPFLKKTYSYGIRKVYHENQDINTKIMYDCLWYHGMNLVAHQPYVMTSLKSEV